MTTTAEDFLNEPDVKPKPEELSGRKFLVQILTAAERDYCYEADLPTLDRKARLLEVGILGTDGEQLFEPEQATAMLDKRNNSIETLISLVIKHNQANKDPEPVGNGS